MLRKRMPLKTELRWAIATTLLSWVLSLTEKELSKEGLLALAQLADELASPDPKHETEFMKPK